jgi:alkylation response protein AidB-like acyl-CoA dehydrogenase
MLRDSVTAFTARASDTKRIRALRGTEPGFDRALWQSLAEQGWLGILAPETGGGQALGFAEMRIVVEGLAQALMPEPYTACAGLATRVLVHAQGAAAHANALLSAMTAGEKIVALAWQESLTGTGFTCNGTPMQNGRLNGTKRFVTPAAGADGYIVAATQGLYYVPAQAHGVTRTLEKRSDGTFSGILKFSDTPVAADGVLATGAVAAAALTRALHEATILASCELFAVMSRALATTVDYMKTRVQFGRPIGSFQGLQHRAVDLLIQKELASALLDDAIRELDATPDMPMERLAELAHRCKSRCSDAGMDITRECIRLHGAIGFTDDCDIGLCLQRALVLSAWLGNAAEHRRAFDATRETHRDTEAASTAARSQAKAAQLPGAPGERPRDTDWNALSDEEFRLEAIAFFEKHYPKEYLFMQRRPHKADVFGYMQTCAKYGWLAPAWPRKWGGMELSPAKQVILFEERERIGVTRVLEHGINLLGPALMKFGTPEQQQHYLPKILSVEYLFCQGYSEPNAGSDLASLQTSAEPDGDDYIINGSKIWTSLAQDANHMFLLARTDKNAKRQAGITFFILDFKTPGVTIRPIRNITGHEDFCQVFFDNVRIPAKNIVGGLNNGWTVAKGLLGFERLNSGSPRRPQYPMLKAREIAKARGLWSDPEFRSKYTKLELDVDDLATLFQRYADVIGAGGSPGPDMSMLKIWSSETTMRMNGLMLEVAGSAGANAGEVVFGEVDGEQAKVDLLGSYYILFPATIAAGSNDIQRNILAKRVLGLP